MCVRVCVCEGGYVCTVSIYSMSALPTLSGVIN